MRSGLKELLDSIHPRRTLEQTAGRADEAINTFSAGGPSQITDWDEFRRCVIRFARHVDTKILRVRRMPDMKLDYAWSHYSKVLQKAYGRTGEMAAFEMARAGTEGGLYGVFRKVAETQAEQYAQNEIDARISRFWEGLSATEKLKAADEYLGEYGDLLPSELTENGAARVKMDFPKVLAEHPRTMQRLGRIGRS
jgi:hypothetical protein